MALVLASGIASLVTQQTAYGGLEAYAVTTASLLGAWGKSSPNKPGGAGHFVRNARTTPCLPTTHKQADANYIVN